MFRLCVELQRFYEARQFFFISRKKSLDFFFLFFCFYFGTSIELFLQSNTFTAYRSLNNQQFGTSHLLQAQLVDSEAAPLCPALISGRFILCCSSTEAVVPTFQAQAGSQHYQTQNICLFIVALDVFPPNQN